MATIDSKKAVDKLIANNGYYEDDERVIKIVQYENNWGGISYGLIYQSESLDRYNPSPFIHNPKVLFEAK